MKQEMKTTGENSVTAWYHEQLKKPLEEIYEDIFFRMDNFEGEEWYGDIEIYAGIGVCQPEPEHLETVQKALKILGYETHVSDRDGKSYLLPGEYCDKENLIACSEKLLKETEQYKEREGTGEKNYEITCILVKGDLEKPEDMIAYAEQADNYLILHPLGKLQEAEQSRGFHFDSEVFFPLEKGYDIIFMTAERHCDIWAMLEKYKEEQVLHEQGLGKYLEYCKENMITREYLQNETSYFGADIEFRLHAEYIVIVTLPTDSKQMQMGVHIKDGSLATWEVADGIYQQAHFFSDRDSATEDLCRRTLDELSLKKQVQKKEQGRGR